MRFKQSNSMKITVLTEQVQYLSSKERLEAAFKDTDVFAYDIYKNESLIGFSMLKKFDEKSYFLWNFAIDYKYQNQRYGTEALSKLINYLQDNYDMKIMTTTYTFGNNHAKHLYEKIGFIETSVIENDDCHEINMIYYC